MYGIPKDLNISSIVTESISQIRVGQFDIQFSIGDIDFSITSSITLRKNGEIVGCWAEGKWPDAEFYNIISVEVSQYFVKEKSQIVIQFSNNIDMILEETLDFGESIVIHRKGDSFPIVI